MDFGECHNCAIGVAHALPMNLMGGGSSDGHGKFSNSDVVQRSELEGKDSHLPAHVFWGAIPSEDRGRVCCLLKLGHAGLLGSGYFC